MSSPDQPQDGRVLRIGTRGSVLATTQAGHVRDALIAAGYPAELHIVRTEGDLNMAPVERIGVGVFVHALRDALHRGHCDIAVHSFKDLPTAADDRFCPIASPAREFPTDVLIARDGLTVDTLPQGARVGTSAPRRRAQLAALRPDLDLVPLRGNIETRMRFVTDGDLDAVVLAGAGLARTGRLGQATEKFTPAQMLPAPAQGALAVESRVDDALAVAAVASVQHAATMVAVAAERQLLATLEAGCTAPVGALARFDGSELVLEAVVAALDGTRVLRESRTATIDGVTGDSTGAPTAEQMAAAGRLGVELARVLLDRGAAQVVEGAAAQADARTPLAPTVRKGAGESVVIQHPGDPAPGRTGATSGDAAPPGAKPGGQDPAGKPPAGG